MTYTFNAVEYKMEFHHGAGVHLRFKEPRMVTSIQILNPDKTVHLTATAFFNPTNKEPFNREIMRQAAIEKLLYGTGLHPQEYALIRRAYFLRRRKTKAARLQTKLFNRELRQIIHDGDCAQAVRTAAAFLYAYGIAMNSGAQAKVRV